MKVRIILFFIFLLFSCADNHWEWEVIDRLYYENTDYQRYVVVLRRDYNNEIAVVTDDLALWKLTEKANWVNNQSGWQPVRWREDE